MDQKEAAIIYALFPYFAFAFRMAKVDFLRVKIAFRSLSVLTKEVQE
jgi:hypothetical protein